MPSNTTEYMQKYYLEKKEHLKALNTPKWTCDICEKTLTGHRPRHMKRQHPELLELIPELPKEAAAEHVAEN